jgi:hypothetical protein
MTAPDLRDQMAMAALTPTYEEMVALYAEKNGPLSDCRDDYASWSNVPISIQSAVIAWDAARRGGSNEAPMSERNALSLCGMMRQALVATTRGFDDAVEDELRILRKFRADAMLAERNRTTKGEDHV